MVVLFIGLGIFAYWKIYHRKSSSGAKYLKGNTQDFHPAKLDKLRSEGQIGSKVDSSAKVYTASSASEGQDKEKKNQIFDEILDEIK